MAAATRHRSSAWPLAWAWVGLIVYASLHPFSGWQWPEAVPVEWLRLPIPQPRGVGRFDLFGNVLAYMPLGALVCAGMLRGGRRRWAAVATALAFGAALSHVLETLQHLLPLRVPSIIDWALNTAGAALGASVSLAIHAAGGLEGWQRWRERWLDRPSAAGIALLLLWPIGLLFPPPLPFGLGQVLGRLRVLADAALEGTAWDGWLRPPPLDATPLAPGVELLGIAAGLLAPSLLAYSMAPPGGRRIVLVAGALALGLGAATLSTALNFGPDHAFAWLTPPVLPAVGLAAGIAVLCAWLPARSAAALALMATTAMLAVVHHAPADSYFAASLQAWEQGRFIRFHGVAQWVGWVWPWAALAYLLARLMRRTA
ncbi:MAG TPA: VanZ family protein [Methylibium sp.]|uniref:VanZ family protein n=1 Tax=Methylibium sp. TaxID=2067992 RepID=UPI002DB9FD8E|nr:VanZ family protein [Methylibium sp.]HEU4458974.1 VanZ family protein [Methylibium sp.]